jgi:cell division transport system ATP-binding protein
MDNPATARPDPQPLVEFDDVALRYGAGREVLSGIGMRLPAGSFHFVTGPSGAGKSSLLALIHVGALPSRGRIRLFGEDPVAASRRARAALRRRIGVVFQDFRLFDDLDVVDNVALPLRIAGKDPRAHRQEILDLLGWVGLARNLADRPPALSGGEKQRLAIARAVMARPALLLADEPTGNVDDALALRLLYLFEAMHRLGTTVVVATHNARLVGRFGHPELRLDGGRLAPATTGRP